MTEFHLDQFSAGFLSGWTRGPDDLPLLLTLSLGGVPTVTRKEASTYRSDLHEAGIGFGHFGFSFILDKPIGSGTLVEITDAVSQEMLYRGEFVGDTHVGLTFALEAAASIPALSEPYWQSTLTRRDQEVILSGALCLPRGASIHDVAAIDYDTGKILPIHIDQPHQSSLDRLWFVPGDVYEGTLSLEIDDNRKKIGVGIEGRAASSSSRDLNFAAVPSLADLTRFKFAGAERARRVAGSADTLHLFAAGGLTQASQVLEISKSLTIPHDAQVLDWGCGAARVAQFVAMDRPSWRIIGVDIDAVNISWCAENLRGLMEFSLLDLMPPTRFDASSFDFIYGLSVITHLRKDARDAWLAELARIVKPRGYVLLTYMGIWAALQCGRHDAAMEVYASLAAQGISDDMRDFALGPELSSYYRATYNTRDELLSVTSQAFDLVEEYPRSLCYQDAVLLQRR